MRWENLSLVEPADAPRRGLLDRASVTRTFDTPGFAGMTFYEIHARSALNRVPAASRVPFRWTVNPYRGCSHACRYCFARNSHSYLDLDTGLDFDSRIVVKVNVAERLRAELAAPGWRGESVALGTNVDPYQRVEGRYQLMRGVLDALRDAANPFSILTKGTLILRDLDLLAEAAAVTEVRTAVSVGFVDDDLWRAVEPGAPRPRRRLEVCAALGAAGIECGVLMAPVLPGLSDSPAALERAVRGIAAAGAASVTPIVLHLRPGAREWYLGWLGEHHPELLPLYRSLYGGGSYARRAYTERISAQVRDLAGRHGLAGAAAPAVRRTPTRAVTAVSTAAAGRAPVEDQLLLPGFGS
ncbi:Rv2578c family radical SAM protein [Parafrankia discariae]|uniref:Rv2578c family radical SAM protein n=1 Tax=Parafrankia discariae TaxID=365528 RepID=UPI0003731873|nr:Rv2578c family radical SAM protein [Parafrankia discariae]